MLRQGLSSFQDIHLTIFCMLLFLGSFAGIMWWTFLKSRKGIYDKIQTLPYNESETL